MKCDRLSTHMTLTYTSIGLFYLKQTLCYNSFNAKSSLNLQLDKTISFTFSLFGFFFYYYEQKMTSALDCYRKRPKYGNEPFEKHHYNLMEAECAV